MKKALLLVSLSLLAVVVVCSSAALAQNCSSAPNNGWGSNYPSYAAWCSACGGIPSNSGGVSCTPGPNWGRTGGDSSAVNPASHGGFYELGYRFGRWLFSSDSDPVAEAQRQLQEQQMMEELRRRAEEAERQHREEEARRIAEMYNRLASTLKLNGLPHLQLKTSGVAVGGLRLKLGDNAQGYGIPGLPGIYTGGPGPGSGLTPLRESKLKLKTGDDAIGVDQASNANPAGQAPNGGQQGYGIPGLPGIYTGGPGPGSGITPPAQPGLQLKTGDGGAAPPAPAAGISDPGTVDFNRMTPQQLADMAESFSRMTPEEQQRLMAAAQSAPPPQQAPPLPAKGSTAAQASPAPAPVPSPVMTPQTAAQPVASLQQQADASQAAAAATVPEDASAKARAGFDTPLGPGPVRLGATSSTPATLRPPGTAVAANRASVAPPSPTGPATPAPVTSDWVKLYLFPGSEPSGPFPRDPDPPLNNPLREDQKLQADLKAWDDWAIQRATHIHDTSGDRLYPRATQLAALNTSAVKQYAPELLDRYNTDAAFRQRVDLRLQYADEHVALAYYQGLAEAHKAAILEFRAELDKLTAAGTLDRLVPLEDQYRLHPERRQIVQSVWDRVSAGEQAALAKAQAEGSSMLGKEYQFVFQLIRGEAAQQR
jgi:hypothetical protein